MNLLFNRQAGRSLLFVLALELVTLGANWAETKVSYGGPVKLCPTLPRNIVPTEHSIQLRPYLQDRSYDGHIAIHFKIPFRSLKSLCNKIFCSSSKSEECEHEGSLSRIVLHADSSIKIKGISVVASIERGAPYKSIEIKDYTSDAENQMISVNLKEELQHGKNTYMIKISFEGEIRTGEMYGFYISEFAGQEYAITQFQPTGARLVFPCFDEPRFKTRIELRVIGCKGLKVLSNMPEINRQITDRYTDFKISPPMSMHMFAFAIGPFYVSAPVYLAATESRGEIELVASTIGQRVRGESFVLHYAAEAVKKMEAYTGVAYPLRKLDIVAVSCLQNDNAENWGLVFIRNNVSLFDRWNSREDAKIAIAVNIAHVVAHQWFGNLITASEWDDLWITEMVAAQMAFEIARGLVPGVDSEFFFRAATLSGALDLDVGPTSHPLSTKHNDLLTSGGVRKVFDLVTFTKGASLMQMLKNTYGSSQIQKALRTLINKHIYSNFNRGDLFKALAPFGKYVTPPLNKNVNMKQVIGRWVNGAGYQKIGVSEQRTETGCNIRLSITNVNPSEGLAQRMSAEDLALEFKFYDSDPSIPFNPLKEGRFMTRLERHKYWCPASESHSCNVVAPKWYDPDNQYHFVKVSPQPDMSTYYHVFYKNELRSKIMKAIRDGLFVVPMDRLHILDDAVGLARIGVVEPNELLELIRAYEHEEHPGVLLGLLGWSAASREDTAELVSKVLMKNVFKKYQGFEARGNEPMIEQWLRSMALKELVLKNNTNVVVAALEAFKEAREKKSNLEPFLREPVYAAVALYATGDEVDAMLDHGARSRSYEEELRIIDALTLASSKSKLSKVSAFMVTSRLSERDLEPFVQRLESKLDATEIVKLRKMLRDSRGRIESRQNSLSRLSN